MDAHIKEGQLYVQHQKFGKKWKKNWFVLYPASPNGIARLEFFDSPSGSGSGTSTVSGGSNEKTRKLDKKIIRLSECISILPSLTENCPKDNMSAFCVETNDKTHVFAAEKLLAKEWMDLMCDIAFQGGGGSAPDPSAGAPDLQMSENLIYYSREEVNEFWVGVQRTEASERCGLSGSYWLKAESDALILKEPSTRRKVQVWPYKLLRRYGRDRVMFSFEAGRRCDSGPGNFTFDTKQGNEIFSLVDQAIQSQKALAEESRLSCNPELEGPSSLQLLRAVLPVGGALGSGDSSSCSSREADGDSGGSKPGSADGVLSHKEGGEGGAKGPAGSKGRSLPEPPAMLGVMGGAGTPPRSTGGADEQAGLYSEPADSVRLPLHADPLYSDPVDSIKTQISNPLSSARLRPVGDEEPQRKPPDLYSHVYDHITAEVTMVNQRTCALNLNGAGTTGRGARRVSKSAPAGQGPQEHIYDEPEGCAKGSTLPKTIYDEAIAPSGQEWHYSTPSLDKQSELHKQSPPHAPSRGTPFGLKWPKPLPAPKPGRAARKEPAPPSGKHSNINNNNSVWGEGSGELYSKVYKQKPLNSCYTSEHRGLRPDIIYDNLGNI